MTDFDEEGYEPDGPQDPFDARERLAEMMQYRHVFGEQLPTVEDEETPGEVKAYYQQKANRQHRLSEPSNSFRPQRERNGNEVEITFYCARERLAEMMQYRHVFGDTDFTRSLSRFLTAGCHWMEDNHASVSPAQAMATEVRMLEQQRDALQETIKRLTFPAPRKRLALSSKRSWWRRLLRWN